MEPVDFRLMITPDGDGYAVHVAPASGVSYARANLSYSYERTTGFNATRIAS